MGLHMLEAGLKGSSKGRGNSCSRMEISMKETGNQEKCMDAVFSANKMGQENKEYGNTASTCRIM